MMGIIYGFIGFCLAIFGFYSGYLLALFIFDSGKFEEEIKWLVKKILP